MDDAKTADKITPPTAGGSIKETVESILVAFILAFVFRAFVVEAFVIPTGSMAPTLMGAHMRFDCPDCGYHFAVNYSGAANGDEVNIPSFATVPVPEREVIDALGHRKVIYRETPKTYSIFCPNCGYKLPQNDTTNVPVHYGDRILVLKYLYLFNEPRHWDVVVFKSPDDDRQLFQTNYIKRLIGKPGESVMVLDGDVYIAPTTREEPKLEDFKVQTKPEIAQEALWRIVYDNDHHPQGQSRTDGTTWRQPWKLVEGSGWNLETAQSEGHAFSFSNPAGAGIIAFDPTASPNAQPLTDWLGYDQVKPDYQGFHPRSMGFDKPDTYSLSSYPSENNVSDLRLTLVYQRKEGAGPLRMQLSKLGETFVAVIEADKARLLHVGAKGTSQIGADVPISASHPLKIDLQNVDYQVTLKIDGKVIAQSAPADYAPNLRYLMDAYKAGGRLPLPQVRIETQRQSCVISHLNLWRDVYYTNRGGGLRWAIPEQFPDRVVRLGPDEYFVMGDNSPISGDARYWWRKVSLPDEDILADGGRVPGRFMLGKAFFVYWPGGFRVVNGAPAFVPNFGEMRFIH